MIQVYNEEVDSGTGNGFGETKVDPDATGNGMGANG